MAKKKRRLTGRELVELHDPGAYERHERVQRRLRELIAELDRRIEAQRRPAGLS